MKPLAYVLYAPGINCHKETTYAFELAGARSAIINITDLFSGRKLLYACDLLSIPGGFGYGDHLGAGRVLAVDLISQLADQLAEVIQRHIPVLGICNGFQALVECGLLPGMLPPLQHLGKRTAILDRNSSGRFEHWSNVTVRLHDRPSDVGNCVWTNGLDGQFGKLPVAHGEGRLVLSEDATRRVVASYGPQPTGTDKYPASPNGSHIAGICDESGLIMGLMPHPERRVDALHGGDFGLRIFKAGVEAVR